MSDLSELVVRWQAGWGLVRGYPPPVHVKGALRVDINLPRRAIEYIALDSPLEGLAREVRSSRVPTWLTVPTDDRERTTAILVKAGLSIRSPEWLMMCDLSAQEPRETVDGYRTTVWTDDDVTVAEISTRDELAAKGWMGVTGPAKDTAVADQIWTDERHRRRGLGSLLMGLLTQTAKARGARTGLLIASEDGRALYQALGWSIVCDVVVASSTPR